MRMFHAAWPASQRPALRPTRGSGDGAVAETIGVDRRRHHRRRRRRRRRRRAAAAAGGRAAAARRRCGGGAAAAARPAARGGRRRARRRRRGGRRRRRRGRGRRRARRRRGGDAPVVDELAHAGRPSAAASRTANSTADQPADRRGRDDSDFMAVRSSSISLHAIDLDRLIGVHVGRELEHRFVLRRAVRP